MVTTAKKTEAALAAPRVSRFVEVFGTERSSFVPMMLTAAGASLVLLLVAATAAALFGPPDAVVAVVAGVILAAQFFAFGSLALRLLMFGPSNGTLVLGAMSIYFVQVLTLFGVLLVLPTDAVPAPQWFAAAAGLETVVWQAGMGAALLGSRVLAYTPQPRPSRSMPQSQEVGA